LPVALLYRRSFAGTAPKGINQYKTCAEDQIFNGYLYLRKLICSTFLNWFFAAIDKRNSPLDLRP
jgi:hypothetical protein